MKSLELHLHSVREEESIIVTSLILQLMVTYQYPQLAAFLVVAYSWVDSFWLKVTKRGINFSNYELFSLDTGLFLMFMSWVSKDPWGLLLGEGHTRRGLAMGRMGITNAIMLLQAIFLYMLSSDDSTNAVSKISFYVDITYRILLCLWFLYTGCCYVKNRLCNCARWWSDDLNNVNHLPQNSAHSDHSVEEESPSLNTPAGNALTHNNLFIRFSDDVNPHGHCQKLSDEFHNFHQYAPYEPRLFYQQCQWSSSLDLLCTIQFLRHAGLYVWFVCLYLSVETFCVQNNNLRQ